MSDVCFHNTVGKMVKVLRISFWLLATTLLVIYSKLA
jgi:hypothetical protein